MPKEPTPQEPTPIRRGAASSGASSTGSARAESDGAGGGFFENAGPSFDRENPPPETPPPAPDEGRLLVEWDEERIRMLLTAQGQLVHAAVAFDKTTGEWIYTDGEKDAIAPPLTSILNRYDATRAAAAAGDELALIIGLAGYVGRSYGVRRAAIARAAAEYEDAPVSGMPAPPGTGPEDDAAWQATRDPLADEIPPLGGR